MNQSFHRVDLCCVLIWSCKIPLHIICLPCKKWSCDQYIHKGAMSFIIHCDGYHCRKIIHLMNFVAPNVTYFLTSQMLEDSAFICSLFCLILNPLQGRQISIKASHISTKSTVCLTACSCQQKKRKHQSSASLALSQGNQMLGSSTMASYGESKHFHM